MSQKSQGRPVDPGSERSRKPWDRLGMSRASFYWRKRYGDLPKRPLKKNTVKRRTWEELVASL